MPEILHKQDVALTRAVAAGDEAAFKQFFTTYFPRLYRFAQVRAGDNAALAEEMAQQTLCKVIGKLGSYRGEASLFTWLCQICRHEFSAHWRRANSDPARHVPLEDGAELRAALESLSSGLEDPEVFSEGQETARLVRVALDYLPENYCLALEMKYLHGERVDAVASALGIGAKAAESVLGRARRAFKEAFELLVQSETGQRADG